MSVFVNDTFTGAAGTDLATYSASWVKHSISSTRNAVLSDSNRVRSNSGSGEVVYYNTGSPANANYRVSADIRVLSNVSGSNAAVLARADTSAATCYAAFLEGNGSTSATWYLYKRVAGAWTQLGSASQTVAVNTSYNVKLECIGSAIKVYVNGSSTPAISVTDSSVTAAGQSGLRFNVSSASDTTAFHIDNLVSEDVITLAAANLAQAQTAENATLTVRPMLTPANLGQSQSIGTSSLTQHYIISPSHVHQAQLIDAATVTYFAFAEATGKPGQAVRYYCYIDGAQVPITSVQLRKSTDRGIYLQVVVHDSSIAVEEGSTLSVDAVLQYVNGSIYTQTIADTIVTDITIDEGPTSNAITIAGEDAAAVFTNYVRSPQNITTTRVLGGKRYLRMPIDIDMSPGDRLRMSDDSIMVVDTITYFASASQAFMEASE